MDADRIANIAAYHASRGARVLVVRNTVNAAQEVVRELTDTGAGDLLMSISGLPALHHSRFAAEDRERLDAEIERILATDVNREKRGYIAVGTQTLEQSLDIDADILITDLCPIDVLLQRLGRLHRKFGMPRKAEYADPRAIVCVPQEGIDYLSEPRYKNGLGGWIDEETNKLEGNYIDIVCLELTRRLIDTDPIWEIPKMNRYLVEKATHPDMHKKLLKEKGRGWINYYKLMRTRFSTEKRSASIVVLDRNIPLPEAYGARPGTRLGEIGATLKFPRGTKSPFGGFINQITLPEHWSKYIEDFAPVTITQVNETTFIMEVETLGGGAVSFLYNNLGLQILTQG